MNPLSPQRRRQNPILAQRRLKAEAAARAHKGSGQVPPPPPPGGDGDKGDADPAGGSTPPADIDKRREALEMLPDADLHLKAAALLHDHDETWDRSKLISRLLEAGVAG